MRWHANTVARVAGAACVDHATACCSASYVSPSLASDTTRPRLGAGVGAGAGVAGGVAASSSVPAAAPGGALSVRFTLCSHALAICRRDDDVDAGVAGGGGGDAAAVARCCAVAPSAAAARALASAASMTSH